MISRMSIHEEPFLLQQPALAQLDALLMGQREPEPVHDPRAAVRIPFELVRKPLRRALLVADRSLHVLLEGLRPYELAQPPAAVVVRALVLRVHRLLQRLLLSAQLLDQDSQLVRVVLVLVLVLVLV